MIHQDFDSEFQAQLTAHVSHRREPYGPASTTLEKAMNYSLFLSGKRIRPRLLLTIGAAQELKPADLWPFALSLEAYHCFSLIHDDLPCMDDDDERRGHPSNHKVFGEAIALLAGDALLVLALEFPFLHRETAREISTTSQSFTSAYHELLMAYGPAGVPSGQTLEISHDPSQPWTFEELHRVHRQKTGALFGVCASVPTALSGAPPETVNRARTWGERAGVLFQIRDDMDDSGQDDASSILFVKNREQWTAWIESEWRELRRESRELWGEAAPQIETLLAPYIPQNLINTKDSV